MQQRSIQELLQVMLDNQSLFSEGLCWWVHCLYWEHIINYRERNLLLDYIGKNRPSKYSSVNAFLNSKRRFYWFEDNIKPRIKWIKYHIKKNN